MAAAHADSVAVKECADVLPCASASALSVSVCASSQAQLPLSAEPTAPMVVPDAFSPRAASHTAAPLAVTELTTPLVAASHGFSEKAQVTLSDIAPPIRVEVATLSTKTTAAVADRTADERAKTAALSPPAKLPRQQAAPSSAAGRLPRMEL